MTIDEMRAFLREYGPNSMAFAAERERGASPREAAQNMAMGLQLGMIFGWPPRDGLTDPLAFAAALESGQLDQEIAAILGYV